MSLVVPSLFPLARNSSESALRLVGREELEDNRLALFVCSQ